MALYSNTRICLFYQVVSGIVVKIIGLLVIFAGSNLWLGLVFDLGYYKTYPTEKPIQLSNSTISYF